MLCFSSSSVYLRPATPRTTKLSLVNVPVLSKQQISTFPANGILKGSVQNTSMQEGRRQFNHCCKHLCNILKIINNILHTCKTEMNIYIQSLASAIRDVLTARESSIGSSGGTTEVRMSVHSRNNL